MKTLYIGLATILLSSYDVNAFFFNLGYFLEPIIKPEVNTFGSTIYHDVNSEKLIPFDSRENSVPQSNFVQSSERNFNRDKRRNKNLRS